MSIPATASNNRSSSSVNASELFTIKSMRSASFSTFLERSTPIRSTISSVSRIPAVSTRRRGTPRTLTYSSIISRVVPATSVTIALFSCTKLLSNDDFPTFGRPTITVDNPSRKIFPCDDVRNNSSISFFTHVPFSIIKGIVTSSTSSYSG